jgi:tetraacyldisaccharide 4'-kinase
MRDPAFWWAERSTAATLLAPVGACYGAIAAWRMARVGRKAAVPVICVGNFTVGGAGKTPTALALARLLLACGHRPFFLSRGYGGRSAGPVRLAHQRADEVGDEPLLLGGVAPTIVARDRPAGATMAADGGADVIVMDDGLQNPSLAKDLSIAVVDARRAIGNGCVFPAGPLRAPLEAQLDHVDAVLLVGPASRAADATLAAAQRRRLPVFHGELRPDPDAVAALAGKPVLAFAGIADPDKFFATLEASGILAAARMPFRDHHRYAAAETAALIARAERDGLTLVTTEKDMVRMQGDPAARALAAKTAVLRVTLVLREEAAVAAMLRDVMRRGGAPPSRLKSPAPGAGA